jgi:hypothetical protein
MRMMAWLICTLQEASRGSVQTGITALNMVACISQGTVKLFPLVNFLPQGLVMWFFSLLTVSFSRNVWYVSGLF